ncbi:hypothetical protein ACWFMI_25245 [Nocardiopsis terrae]|uniref:hypothetical protein n=1 Tax=Streptomyces sp. NPDC057554 TaxID=3350538 RepID=UPI00369B23F0
MPDMEPGEVFIAPLGSDPSQADTWLPVGTLNEVVEHEPADTTPLNLTGLDALTTEVKGGTVPLPAPAPAPPREHRVRLDLPGREPRYGTIGPASVDYDPDTGTAQVPIVLDPLPLDAVLARAWADDLFSTTPTEETTP